MAKFITSRGRLEELRTAEANLACTAQHMYDTFSATGELTEDHKKLVTTLNEARMLLRKQYLPEDYDNNYHCADKHAMLAKMQHNEAMESLIRTGQEVPQDVIDTQILLDEVSSRALALLLGIPQSDLEIEGCAKCLGDFIESQDEQVATKIKVNVKPKN